MKTYKKICKIFISDKYSSLILILKYLIAALFVFIFSKPINKYRKKVKDREKNFKIFKVTLVELALIRPKRHPQVNYFSIPFSSEINAPFPYTADSYLQSNWHGQLRLPRISNKSPTLILFIGKLITFYAEIIISRGYYDLGYAIYLWLDSHSNKEYKILGKLGLLDLYFLFYRWNMQLKNFRDQSIWLDLDKLPHYSDELSILFQMGTNTNVEKIFRELIEIDLDNVPAKVIYSEYLVLLNKINDSFDVLNSIKSGSTYPLIQRRIEHFTKFIDGNTNDKYVAEILYLKQASNNIVNQNENQNENVTGYFKYSLTTPPYDKKYQRELFKVKFKGQSIAILKNAYILGSIVGCKLDDKPIIIRDLHPFNFSLFQMFNRYMYLYDEKKALLLKRKEVNNESAFYVAVNGWNYYHWIVEAVPLLIIYKEYYFSAGIPLYFPFEVSKWHRETLKLLKLDKVRIISQPSGAMASFNNLYVPSLTSIDTASSFRSLLKIRSVLAAPKKITKGKHVYLKRKSVDGVRKTKGMYHIEKLLLKKGFQVIEPSTMGVEEQINYFSDVEYMVAEAGAALANLLFCPRNIKVLCITSERSMYSTFSFIASSIGQDLSYAIYPSKLISNPYFLWCAPFFYAKKKLVINWLIDNDIY